MDLVVNAVLVITKSKYFITFISTYLIQCPYIKYNNLVFMYVCVYKKEY